MSRSQDATETGVRALVAEDDPDFLEALEFWLSEYGHLEVTTVTNGTDAIEALDTSVDVFLCDQRMPELAGPEVLDRMTEAGYDVPTIVISAYEPEYHRHDGSVEEYLSKPIDREELFEAIDRVLSE